MFDSQTLAKDLEALPGSKSCLYHLLASVQGRGPLKRTLPKFLWSILRLCFSPSFAALAGAAVNLRVGCSPQGAGSGTDGNPLGVLPCRPVGDGQRALFMQFLGFFLCHGGSLQSKVILQDLKSQKKTSSFLLACSSLRWS